MNTRSSSQLILKALSNIVAENILFYLFIYLFFFFRENKQMMHMKCRVLFSMKNNKINFKIQICLALAKTWPIAAINAKINA